MSFDTISAKDIEKYAKNSNYVIVDVRSCDEYALSHIPGAVNIPYETINTSLARFDLNKTYIFYCDRGATSLLAARKLYRYGYNVMSVIGGIGAYRGTLENSGK